MPRLDIWDAAAPESIAELDCGFPRRSIESRYTVGPPLGQGGFGSVHVVFDLEHGTELACKSISKVLDIGPNVTPKQQLRHMENIKREVAVLRKLRGTVRVGVRSVVYPAQGSPD
jgi:serine/threonine protein kinase